MIDREKVLAVLGDGQRHRRTAPDFDAAEIARLDCDAGTEHYTIDDVASGRLRLYRHVAVD